MEEQKTFAEWLLNFVKTHRETTITVEPGRCGDIRVRMRDYSKDQPGISARYSILQDVYQDSKLSFDDVLIHTAEDLEKEIENYGKRSERSTL